MSEQLHIPSASLGHQVITKSDHFLMKPSFIASTSVFGPKVILSDCSATKQSINCIFLFAFISVYYSTFQESSLVHFHVFTSNLCNQDAKIALLVCIRCGVFNSPLKTVFNLPIVTKTVLLFAMAEIRMQEFFCYVDHK